MIPKGMIQAARECVSKHLKEITTNQLRTHLCKQSQIGVRVVSDEITCAEGFALFDEHEQDLIICISTVVILEELNLREKNDEVSLSVSDPRM